MMEQILGRIMNIREMIESLSVIRSFVTNGGKENLNEGNFREELYRRELDEWRGLMMWGLVCDEKDRQRLKAAAYERFIGERMDVRRWIFDGSEPSSWMVKDEENFRKQAKELFKPDEQ